MKQRSDSGKRTAQQLSDSLHQRLNSYALAASAAGVGMLALAQAAEAKIVYTKTHQNIGTNGIYELDLNHDGVVDFLIQEWGATYNTSNASHNWLLAKEALGNAVAGSIKSTSRSHYKRYYAAALKLGAKIGPHRDLIKGGPNGEAMVYFWEDQDFQTPHTYGQWIDVKNRYLGFQFKIKGATHYGWARLSVHNKHSLISATLTGYAYETVANRSIRAGQTSGVAELDHAGRNASVSSHQEDPSLGQLALGAVRRQP